jgi:hypothetical protein
VQRCSYQTPSLALEEEFLEDPGGILRVGNAVTDGTLITEDLVVVAALVGLVFEQRFNSTSDRR